MPNVHLFEAPCFATNLSYASTVAGVHGTTRLVARALSPTSGEAPEPSPLGEMPPVVCSNLGAPILDTRAVCGQRT